MSVGSRPTVEPEQETVPVIDDWWYTPRYPFGHEWDIGDGGSYNVGWGGDIIKIYANINDVNPNYNVFINYGYCHDTGCGQGEPDFGPEDDPIGPPWIPPVGGWLMDYDGGSLYSYTLIGDWSKLGVPTYPAANDLIHVYGGPPLIYAVNNSDPTDRISFNTPFDVYPYWPPTQINVTPQASQMQVDPGAALWVNGSANYYHNHNIWQGQPPCDETNVTIKIEPGGTEFEGKTDINGDFSILITAPMTPGFYTVNTTVFNTSLNHNGDANRDAISVCDEIQIEVLGLGDIQPPDHLNELPPIDGETYGLSPTISVDVTDPSGVNASTIRLYVKGFMVFYDLAPIPDGYKVSYWHETGFSEDEVVDCRIVADDMLGNHLDFSWGFTVRGPIQIPLHQGWNLISLPLMQPDVSIDQVLSSIDGKWDIIQAYDPTDITDHWKTNATYKPDQLNDLKTLNHTRGFWIHITEATAVEVVNETVYGPSLGGEMGPFYLDHGNVVDCTVYISVMGMWISLYEGVDYSFNYATGEITIDGPGQIAPMGVGWTLYAYYNYSSLNLAVSGDIQTSTTIPLYAGWNLVGYPTLNETMTIADAFVGTGADRFEICDTSAPYRLMEVSPTHIMMPGVGYWVRVHVDTIWSVDW